jgi:tetratricopeptide (TPR) repeat protein
LSEDRTESGKKSVADAFITAAVACEVFARVLISATVHPWTGYLVNATLGAIVILILALKPDRMKLQDRLLVWGLALYFSAAFVSIAFSIMPWNSLRWFLFHIGDLFLFLAVLGAGRGSLPGVAAAVVFAGALSAAFALRQHLGGFAATMQSDGVTDYALQTLQEGRVFGLTFSPDMMASVIAGLLPVCLCFLKSGASRMVSGDGAGRPATILYALTFILFLAVLFLTKSVGGFMAAGAGVLVWLFLHLGASAFNRRHALAAACAVFLILAGALVIAHLRGGHVFNLDDAHNPLVRRLDNWATGARVYLEFPVTGAGAGQYGLASLYHRSLAGNEAKHAHNLLIEALAETGPVGFAGLCLILAGFSRRVFLLFGKKSSTAESATGDRRGPSEPFDGGGDIRTGLVAGGCAVALHSMIDFDFSVAEVAAFFWIALAASIEARGHVESSYDKPAGKRRAVRAIVAAAIVVIALFEFYQARGAWLRERAVNLAREGDWVGAGSYAGRALSWDGTSDEMYGLLARAAATTSADRPEAVSEARAALEKAISLNPRYPYHYRDLGLLLLRRDKAAAGERFEKAVSLYPNNMGLNIHLGRWLRMEGRFEEAEQVLEHAVECHKNNGDALFELGALYSVQGRHDQAGKYLERSAWRAPVSGRRATAFSEFLVKQGKPKEAAEFLKSWSKKHPGRELVEAKQEKHKIKADGGHPDQIR